VSVTDIDRPFIIVVVASRWLIVLLLLLPLHPLLLTRLSCSGALLRCVAVGREKVRDHRRW
jgi:hypothetical protein